LAEVDEHSLLISALVGVDRLFSASLPQVVEADS